MATQIPPPLTPEQISDAKRVSEALVNELGSLVETILRAWSDREIKLVEGILVAKEGVNLTTTILGIIMEMPKEVSHYIPTALKGVKID